MALIGPLISIVDTFTRCGATGGGMSVNFGRLDTQGHSASSRCLVALAIVIVNASAVLLCYRLDFFGFFGSSVSCPSLGLPERVCSVLTGQLVPAFIVLPAVLLGTVFALGLYDPRPLISRLEQSRRPHSWLLLNAAGTAVILLPYCFAAAGLPVSKFAPFSLHLVILGIAMAAIALLFWLSDAEQLDGTLKSRHILHVFTMLLTTFAVNEWVQYLSWGFPAFQRATFNTVIFLLTIIGAATSTPEDFIIGVGSFWVMVELSCSGIAGIILICVVMAGYIVLFRKRLNVGRAVLLVPMAASLSWALNAVRIAALLIIGAYVSPELAIGGFHSSAGWLAFCTLSALMVLLAENISWIHRADKTSVAVASATPFLSDPAVARIAPFSVLLVSSLLSAAIFLQPEAGYPMRAILMAASVTLFWRAYRAELRPVDALSLLAGGAVALFWLFFRIGDNSLTVTAILGPASQAVVAIWVSCRIVGTVLLVPFIEEMFFRGYLLQRLDFGGCLGKGAALGISSILFGALHSNLVLASASGLVFGLLALRKRRIFDAVVAHATANGLIAAWALWTGDWSVI